MNFLCESDCIYTLLTPGLQSHDEMKCWTIQCLLVCPNGSQVCSELNHGFHHGILAPDLSCYYSNSLVIKIFSISMYIFLVC